MDMRLFDNIFVKDIYICAGNDISEFNNDYVKLYTTEKTTYTKEERTTNEKIPTRELELRWVHLFDGNPKQIKELDSNSEIHWYRYRIGAAAADNYCGVYWESIENNGKDPFKLQVELNTEQQQEKFKAIAFYNKVPYRSNEVVFDNKEIKEEIEEYVEKMKIAIKKEDIRALLEKCKKLTMSIKYVENEETKKLKDRLLSFGIKETEMPEAFKAIKSVWASKYNERVFIATSKVGIKMEDIRMAVLCQKIIPAEYAYVIHTKNPSTNDPNEVFAEVVNGMGETLVGAYEGQSFSFAYNKTSRTYDIKSYQNKSISLRNSGFIFRSDSNTEDLEGFSGAGLFDSVPMESDSEVEMGYYNDRMFTDDKFVDNAVNKIASLGIGVENLYNYPQDIEGVYYDGNFYIVQTRPQV